MSSILKAENISKQYRLGLVGTGTLSDDLKRWWYQVRGKEDPFLKIGAVNDRGAKAKEDYVWALRDINFEVPPGEVLGIIGKNGAGKSTLLKLLSRVTSPTTGSIKTRGRIASLLEIGTGFHPELTGRENIFMNGAVLGMTKAEIKAKLDEIIAFSGCEMYIDTPVKRYSSGMTVRLGFAVAAHLEPEILVIDEVLAVGDAEFQKKAIGKMHDLSTGEGRTILFVSHNMASINNLCEKTIVLENGSVAFEGKTQEGIAFYLQSNQSRENKYEYVKENNKTGSGILKIFLQDKQGIKKSEFGFHEIIKIKLKIRINSDAIGSYIGFRIADRMDRIIFTSELKVEKSKKSTKIFDVEVELPKQFLVPNKYYMTFALHIPNVHMIDLLEECISFEIVETGSIFSKYSGVDYGCVFVNCNWTILN